MIGLLYGITVILALVVTGLVCRWRWGLGGNEKGENDD